MNLFSVPAALSFQRILKAAARASCVMASLLLLSAGAAPEGRGDSGNSSGANRPKGGELARKAHAANLARCKDDPDALVLPGLVANRKTRRVELLAEASGLAANSTIEFLLVDVASSHGYEALLWSFARPGDVHAALAFIGIPPGASYNPGQLRLWPKGERVNISIAATNAAPGAKLPRVESLVLDTKAGKPMPEEGFMFTGSMNVPAPNGGTGVVYMADAYDPKSIVSLYNEPGTVMDVPRPANQGDVYASQVVNPEHMLSAGEILTLILEPERTDGSRRVRDLVLEIGLAAARPDPAPGAAEAGRSIAFVLKEAGGATLGKEPTLEGAVAAVSEVVKKGCDPYVSIRFDRALKLAEVRRACIVVGMLEAASGMRIEPPPQGQLYFKAFMPDERWREPAGRFAQPWELHLSRGKGGVTGRLVINEETWTDASPDPNLKAISFDAPTPKALRARLDADAQERKQASKRPGLAVLLVFADADLSYGELMTFVGPALSTHNTVHVFLPPGK